MARSDLVKALMRSHQHGDDAGFRKAAEELIRDERRKRHDLVADQLEAILEDTPRRRRPLQVSSLRPLPKTRDDLDLITLEEPRTSFQDLVLPAGAVEVLESLVDEFRQRSALRAHGVEPRSSLLLVGPPGCGKSASAEAIAGELGIPVARVQLATIVSSYLGETARHLEQVFSFLDVGSWVLVFDEIDMLGRERSDRADHGELRRVVASMLQVVERHRGDSLFVATSNHPTLLDSAVWRRFDEVVELPPPDVGARAEILGLKLRSVRHDVDLNGAAKQTDGFSAAEVELVALDAIRLMVRQLDKQVTEKHVDYGIKRGEARRRIVHNSQVAVTEDEQAIDSERPPTPSELGSRRRDLIPPTQTRSRSANQLARKVFSQKIQPDRDVPMYLVVRNINRWDDPHGAEHYGLALSLWRDEDRGEIHAELQTQLEAVVELPVEIELEL